MENNNICYLLSMIEIFNRINYIKNLIQIPNLLKILYSQKFLNNIEKLIIGRINRFDTAG